MKQYYRILSEKGAISLPYELRRQAGLKADDVLRLSVYGQMVLMEKAEIQDLDMLSKLRASACGNEMPQEAVESYILAALEHMDSNGVAKIAEYLRQKKGKEGEAIWKNRRKRS